MNNDAKKTKQLSIIQSDSTSSVNRLKSTKKAPLITSPKHLSKTFI